MNKCFYTVSFLLFFFVGGLTIFAADKAPSRKPWDPQPNEEVAWPYGWPGCRMEDQVDPLDTNCDKALEETPYYQHKDPIIKNKRVLGIQLLRAIKLGDVHAIINLVNNPETDINFCSHVFETPLLLALSDCLVQETYPESFRFKSRELVFFLISRGAQPEEKSLQESHDVWEGKPCWSNEKFKRYNELYGEFLKQVEQGMHVMDYAESPYAIGGNAINICGDAINVDMLLVANDVSPKRLNNTLNFKLIDMPTDIWKNISSFLLKSYDHWSGDHVKLVHLGAFKESRLLALGYKKAELDTLKVLPVPVPAPEPRQPKPVPASVSEAKNNTVRNFAIGGVSLLALTVAEFTRLCKKDLKTKQSVLKHGKTKTFLRYYCYALRHPIQSFKSYKLFTMLALSLPLGGVSVGAAKTTR